MQSYRVAQAQRSNSGALKGSGCDWCAGIPCAAGAAAASGAPASRSSATSRAPCASCAASAAACQRCNRAQSGHCLCALLTAHLTAAQGAEGDGPPKCGLIHGAVFAEMPGA